MTSTYASIRQQYLADFSFASVASGNFTVGGSINLYVQGRNRVGVNLLSASTTIAYSSGEKIQITLNPGLRASGEDLHRLVVSGETSGLDTDAKVLIEWEAKAPNQTTDNALPVVVELTDDEHLGLGVTVADIPSLPSNPVNGMQRFITSEGTYYRYNTLAAEWQIYSYGWSTYVASTESLGGCDRPINDLGTNVIIVPPNYAGTGGDSTYIDLWVNNGLVAGGGAVIPQGSQIDFQLTVNDDTITPRGNPWNSVFKGLIEYEILGVVTRGDGTLDNSTATSKVAWAGAFDLPIDLIQGEALAVRVNLDFDQSALAHPLPDGAQVGILVYNSGLRGTEFRAGYFTGSAVLQGKYMRVGSDDGAGFVRILEGVVIVAPSSGAAPSISPYRQQQDEIGLLADTADQKVYLNAGLGGTALIRQSADVPLSGEALRAIVSTEPGNGAPSAWSNLVTISAGQSLIVDVSHNQTVRNSYPDANIQGETDFYFNPPRMRVFLRIGGVVNEVADVAVVNAPTQQFTLTSISPTVIGTLPPATSSDFSLFEPSGVTASTGAGGTLTADDYEVAVAYYYPSPNNWVSKVSHSTVLGCIPEIQGSLSDVIGGIEYIKAPVVDNTALKALPQSAIDDGEVRYVEASSFLYYYDISSTAADDGVTVLEPTFGTGRWLVVVAPTAASIDPWNNPIDTIANLKALTLGSVINNQIRYLEENDYLYRYDPTNSDPDDGLLVLEPTGIPSGRWLAITTPPTGGGGGGIAIVADITALTALTGMSDGEQRVVMTPLAGYPPATYTYLLGSTLNVMSPVCVDAGDSSGQWVSDNITVNLPGNPGGGDLAPFVGVIAIIPSTGRTYAATDTAGDWDRLG